MIQLNLLPDVKQDYIRAEQSRRLVISVSVIVTAVSVGILLLLLSVSGLQKKHIKDLTSDIKKETATLKAKPQISKILTVQNQLETLPRLHSEKPAVAHLFDFLNQVTPNNVDITSLKVDFTTQTATITGTTDALSTVNKYVDTLKFTKYTDGTDTKQTPAFKNVVLTSFAVVGGNGSTASNPNAIAKSASYTITFNYDQSIFDITKKINLVVPKLTTTRSTSDSPAVLFNTGGSN